MLHCASIAWHTVFKKHRSLPPKKKKKRKICSQWVFFSVSQLHVCSCYWDSSVNTHMHTQIYTFGCTISWLLISTCMRSTTRAWAHTCLHTHKHTHTYTHTHTHTHKMDFLFWQFYYCWNWGHTQHWLTSTTIHEHKTLKSIYIYLYIITITLHLTYGVKCRHISDLNHSGRSHTILKHNSNEIYSTPWFYVISFSFMLLSFKLKRATQ